MIKFFRKIRYNLMEQNKTRKYFKYAIGEIILVVVGILIALQINTWNQDIINTSNEQNYLVGLKNDLEKQINAFNGSVEFGNIIIDIGESTLEDFSLTGNLLQIDSINSKLSKMMYSLSYPNIETTFNELNTTGQLNLIKEKSLRSKIIKYYQNSESNKESVNGNLQNVFYNQIFPTIKSSVIIHPENFRFNSKKINKALIREKLNVEFESNLVKPDKEFEIVNAISMVIIVTNTNIKHIQNSLEEAELLLKDINKELNND
ncbi:hypothetical protein [Formosa maritima]|uniref:Uncharacterized protein n=1 Tax=Formosa maritima TaxID=2592046 RepID=A0A5D0GKY7_9FLAO|nr:hypothetical protein [Formosa maritima]TYA59668.1 hypothetical protein FVF61_01040 [Formosa maritima]